MFTKIDSSHSVAVSFEYFSAGILNHSLLHVVFSLYKLSMDINFQSASVHGNDWVILLHWFSYFQTIVWLHWQCILDCSSAETLNYASFWKSWVKYSFFQYILLYSSVHFSFNYIMKNNPIPLHCYHHTSQVGPCLLVWIVHSSFQFDYMNWD